MWALFTRALTAGSSATRVSILNTSANFLVTAILGFVVFSESLPPLWFLGATFLVVGNVVIGRKGEKSDGESDEVERESLVGEDVRREGAIKLGDDVGAAREEEEGMEIPGDGDGEWDALLEVDEVKDEDTKRK